MNKKLTLSGIVLLTVMTLTVVFLLPWSWLSSRDYDVIGRGTTVVTTIGATMIGGDHGGGRRYR